jgi:sulfur-carrier protein
VNVSFFATLRQVVGERSADVPVPAGGTVRDVLRSATDLYPGLRPLLLDDSGALLGNVHVIVNGRDVWYLSHGLETPLVETDKVLFFPAVGGGAST